jgi:hypothetical protein
MPMRDLCFLMAAITVFRDVTPYSLVKFTDVSEDTTAIFMWPKTVVLLSRPVFQDTCKMFQYIHNIYTIYTQTFYRMKCN